MKKKLYALSMGAFAFGMAEFIMMSILPDAAQGLNITISKAGNLIASYAFGVCLGGPLLIALTRNMKLRSILAILLLIFMFGSVLTALTTNYWITIAGRFISGLPHGAFFGVAAIVANKISQEGKGTTAVAIVMMGMTLANLLGVPLGNLLSQYISWRFLFIFNGSIGAVAIFLIYKWLPDLSALPKTSILGQFKFLKNLNPWLLIMVTVLLNTGIFCWYSYINPFLTNVSNIDASYMPFMMVVSGGSMCIGNLIGGRLSDRFSPKKAIIFMQIVLVLALLSLFLFGNNIYITLTMLAIAAGCFFGFSSPIQQLFIQNSKGGEMMGGALAQLAFNLGNAIGAIVGGITVIRSGQDYKYTALVGAIWAISAIIVFVIFKTMNRQKSL